MRKVLIGLFIVASLAVFSSLAAAQAPMRVAFDRGRDRTVLTGTLNGYRDHKSFVLRVRRGQRLTTENVGSNHITVNIKVPRGSRYDGDMAADCHDHHEISPTAAGDYVITVAECTKADRWRGTFKLRVIVR